MPALSRHLRCSTSRSLLSSRPLRSNVFLTSQTRAAFPRRTLTSTSIRLSESASPSSSASPAPKFKLSNFKRPIAKCFLVAMLTYQILYYGWLKLETDEIRSEKDAELVRLEEEVRRRTSKNS